MSSGTTQLHLPATLSYPIKVVSIDAKTSTDVDRGTRLLTYSFVYLAVNAPTSTQPETRFGTWDSEIEGSVEQWNLKAGDVVTQVKARNRAAVAILEPCTHSMQLNGLCVLCAKDMTHTDYTGFSDASRASIQMTHSANGPTVSLQEAQRIERENATRLLDSRKLSLIVDLDQTIVHATVDPTVGEWIAEGEAWEARNVPEASTSKLENQTPDDEDDECNPNWEALKDVKKFRLGPESFIAPGSRIPKGKGKAKSIENDGCMYYIKPRPGWKEFLEEMAESYELHVYTMGTRAYAEEVCEAIDPDGKIFGGRLLSRDESGSLTQKSLQRLFPCDTSMVVIIDDRADVWEWSPNLVKVIPYEFFVGIGDINSSFLPKIQPLAPPTTKPDPPVATDVPEAPEAGSAEDEQQKQETKAMISENSQQLSAQMEERPLAKLQEELEDVEEADNSLDVEEPPESSDPPTEAPQVTPPPLETPTTPHKHEKHKKALLKNDDVELDRVKGLLLDVHRRFFEAYNDRGKESSKRRQSISGRAHKQKAVAHDVTRIIPSIRHNVLTGVHILFSSVIPLDTNPEATEIWKLAHMFGAVCSTELTSSVTHVVAAKRGTVKVDAARKRRDISIVWVAWFTDSIALWQRLDEKPYLLDDQPLADPSTSPLIIPNQIRLDEGDLEEDSTSPVPRSLELDDINWNDINDEVDAAMNESDDEDGEGDEGQRDEADSVMSDETNSIKSNGTPPGSPHHKRKRLRSITPSSENSLNSAVDDSLRSPLSKRKKLAAERTGQSRLKEATVIVNEVEEVKSPKETSTPGSSPKGDTMDDLDEDEAEEEDFLAGALDEDWS